MTFVLGDDQQREMFEKKFGKKKIVDWSNVVLPVYNPHQILLARQLSGFSGVEIAKRAHMRYERYRDMERGEKVPTAEEMIRIRNAQDTVTLSFYRQWPETELETTTVGMIPKEIDYYKYKVFRDINKPRMKLV